MRKNTSFLILATLILLALILPCQAFSQTVFKSTATASPSLNQQPANKPSSKAIRDASKSTIIVTSPNSSSAFATGSTYTISWNYEGVPGTVKIELTNTSGSAPLIIATNVSGGDQGSGKFDWIVPPTLVTASGYLVKVSNIINTSITGVSRPFAIVPPSITITQPKSGDQFFGGDRIIPITWKSVGNSFGSTVRITAWRATGSASVLNVQCSLNQGAYSQWKLSPSDENQQFFIRVESTQNPSIADQLPKPIYVLPPLGQAGPGILTPPAGTPILK